jgi:hypothetical protein
MPLAPKGDPQLRRPLNNPLIPRVALDLRLNLVPVCVEHTHGDGVGRPVQIGHADPARVTAI